MDLSWGSCDAGAVDPEWAAKVQQGNILVVNVCRHVDGGSYNCTVWDSSQQVGADSYLLTVAGEYKLYIIFIYIITTYIIILQSHNIAWPRSHGKKMHVFKVPQGMQAIVHICQLQANDGCIL